MFPCDIHSGKKSFKDFHQNIILLLFNENDLDYTYKLRYQFITMVQATCETVWKKVTNNARNINVVIKKWWLDKSVVKFRCDEISWNIQISIWVFNSIWVSFSELFSVSISFSAFVEFYNMSIIVIFFVYLLSAYNSIYNIQININLICNNNLVSNFNYQNGNENKIYEINKPPNHNQVVVAVWFLMSFRPFRFFSQGFRQIS